MTGPPRLLTPERSLTPPGDINIPWYPNLTDPNLVLYVPLWYDQYKSDKFYSLDLNKHLCEVTDALWTPQGRTFDGDDWLLFSGFLQAHLDYGVHDWTMLFWIKSSYSTDYQCIWSKTPVASWGGWSKWFHLNITTGYLAFDGYGITPTTSVAAYNDGVWHQLGAKFKASNDTVTLIADGAELNSSTQNLSVDEATQPNIIGARESRSYGLVGTMGEGLIYKCLRTAPELLHDYLVTKWRYEDGLDPVGGRGPFRPLTPAR